MEKQPTDRYRLWFLLLYEDSTTYDFKEVLFNLKSYKNYAYIKHLPEQDEKKEHYHFLLKLDNATTKEALSKKTGLPVNYIQNGRNERALARYLIHADDEEKTQYSPEDVNYSRNYERQFKKYLEDLETEQEIINNIYNYIDSISRIIELNPHDGLRYLINYVNSNCYDTIYKRYRYEFKDYLTSKI